MIIERYSEKKSDIDTDIVPDNPTGEQKELFLDDPEDTQEPSVSTIPSIPI